MSELPTNPTPSVVVPEARAGFELRGTPVAPGLALGTVHRKDYDLSRAHAQRVPLDRIEGELNRFHASLQESKRQLDELRSQLAGKVPADHLRILDTHVAYLRDSVFLSDVENLILNEQMSLEAAIAKVISDFDRIFRLVENELLRERAVDLRDVGIRVLRNLEQPEAAQAPEPGGDYVLVARELSIVDMFHLGGREVLGIVTEEGGMTSHAAILARSMGVPTLTGVDGLLERAAEGDFVILDATEGVVRVNPDEVVRAQYHQVRAARDRGAVPQVEAWNAEAFKTQDGTLVRVRASCGNLPEVERASAAGVRGIGLYRTELLYLIDKEQPSLDSLMAHYGAVLEEAAGEPVTFRLLDVDSSFGIRYLHEGREANPALGQAGARALLTHEGVLRRQLQALLRVAVEGTHVRIAVPFVVDVAELRRVKEAFFEVRMDLQRARHPIDGEVSFGAVVETPAAAMGVRELLQEADFLLVSFDSLSQYLLAADREHRDLGERFETVHPVVLRTLQSVLHAAREAGRECCVTDPGVARPGVLPFVVGAGARDFSLPPVTLDDVQRSLRSFTLERAVDAARKVGSAACQADVLPLVDSFLRAYDAAT
ncbi:MAG: phosphoenolpyruvate--protein phosphotransferase [Planctomycetes bacterium]|nr:phosphoenolpyruvate--protein phosphotransferase [Planctomycetota bacterium]